MRWGDRENRLEQLGTLQNVEGWVRYTVKEIGSNEDVIDFGNLFL
jgi:hypothetical protein